MVAIRALIVGGLLLHKLLWELWKGRGRGAAAAPAAPVTPIKRLLKGAKTGFLVFLVVQALFLNVLPIPGRSKGRRIAGLALFLLGLGMAIAGRGQLGSNWSNIEDGQVRAEQSLETTGIYRYVRHPIYAGDTLLLFGMQLALNSWLVVAMLGPLAFFVRRALAEEAMLATAFPGYAAYRKRSRRFIPFLL
jgi:protein-S-isoprenylcysteine O-methyltransferase Ste14